MSKCPGLCDEKWPQCEKCEIEPYCVRSCFEDGVPLLYCKDCCPCDKEKSEEDDES